MEVKSIPIYRDWSFWAVIVAVSALVLSQLPPIHILLKSAKLDFELYSKISLTHKVGNPNLQLHMIIINDGGSNVRIKGIEATVIRDGKKVAVLPAQNFLQKATDKNNVLFTSFSLKPNEEWGHIVNLLNFFDRNEEKVYRKHEEKLKSDLVEKRKLSKENKNKLLQADSINVEPFHKFFADHFIWTSGEYELIVKVITDTEKANIEKSYRFNLLNIMKMN